MEYSCFSRSFFINLHICIYIYFFFNSLLDFTHSPLVCAYVHTYKLPLKLFVKRKSILVFQFCAECHGGVEGKRRAGDPFYLILLRSIINKLIYLHVCVRSNLQFIILPFSISIFAHTRATVIIMFHFCTLPPPHLTFFFFQVGSTRGVPTLEDGATWRGGGGSRLLHGEGGNQDGECLWAAPRLQANESKRDEE